MQQMMSRGPAGRWDPDLSEFRQRKSRDWFRAQVELYYVQSFILQSIMSALVVASCVTYVLDTYKPHSDLLRWVDHVASAAFTFDYFISIAAALWPLDYFFSLAGISDVLTVLPWWFDLFSQQGDQFTDSSDNAFLKILRLYKVSA